MTVDVAIVGGGIAGCSVAYHLTKRGVTNVALFERKQLTCGTTWHAAGLVTQLRATRNMTELAKYTAELFTTLEEETGQATGYKQNGAVRLAKTEGRLQELRRGVSMARNFGLESWELTLEEIKERWNPVNLDGVIGGTWMPSDGQVGQPRGRDHGDGQGRPHARGQDPRKYSGDADRGRKRPCRGRDDRSGARAGKESRDHRGMWSRDLAASIGATLPLHAAELLHTASFEVEIACRRVAARAQFGPWYDRKGARIKN